jgi:hypothetical protein
MRTNVASAIAVGFGVGLGLAIGGAFVSVAPAFAAGQSGTPSPPVPTLAPPAASIRPVTTGANIPEKVLMYSRRVAFNAAAGGTASQEAWCDAPADAIVTGSCTAPPSTSAKLVSTDILYPTSTDWKTAYRCAFVNDGRSSVQVEVQIVCRRPR